VRFSFALREPLASPAPCWIQRDDRLCEPFYAVMDGPDHYSIGLSEAAPVDIPERQHVREAYRRRRGSPMTAGTSANATTSSA